MRRSPATLAVAALLGAGLTGLPTIATADDPKTAEAAPKADWSGYLSAGDVVGEVTKVDANGFTLRVSWATVQSSGGARSMMSRSRSRSRPTLKEHHEDYQLAFAENGLVRQRKEPVKTDDAGKTIAHTVKELEALHQPAGAPGFAADRGELRAGHVVEVLLLRPQDIPSSKVTLQDLKVKYAIIRGTDPKAVAQDAKASKAKN